MSDDLPPGTILNSLALLSPRDRRLVMDLIVRLSEQPPEVDETLTRDVSFMDFEE